MPIIKLKRSSTPGFGPPSASDLEVGEVAIDTGTGGVWTKTSAGSVVPISLGEQDVITEDMRNQPSGFMGLNEDGVAVGPIIARQVAEADADTDVPPIGDYFIITETKQGGIGQGGSVTARQATILCQHFGPDTIILPDTGDSTTNWNNLKAAVEGWTRPELRVLLGGGVWYSTPATAITVPGTLRSLYVGPAGEGIFNWGIAGLGTISPTVVFVAGHSGDYPMFQMTVGEHQDYRLTFDRILGVADDSGHLFNFATDEEFFTITQTVVLKECHEISPTFFTRSEHVPANENGRILAEDCNLTLVPLTIAAIEVWLRGDNSYITFQPAAASTVRFYMDGGVLKHTSGTSPVELRARNVVISQNALRLDAGSTLIGCAVKGSALTADSAGTSVVIHDCVLENALGGNLTNDANAVNVVDAQIAAAAGAKEFWQLGAW